MENHHYLPALKTIWNYPDEVLNKVLWAFDAEFPEDAGQNLGMVEDYLRYMDGQETDDPQLVWEDWCKYYDIEEENPFV